MYTPPTNWNPFNVGNYATGAQGLIYEPLFLFDPMKNTYIPWLATSGTWSGNTYIPEGASRCQAGFRPAVSHSRSRLQGIAD
jgi:hypothetical protein